MNQPKNHNHDTDESLHRSIIKFLGTLTVLGVGILILTYILFSTQEARESEQSITDTEVVQVAEGSHTIQVV